MTKRGIIINGGIDKLAHQAIFIGATGQDVGKTTLCLGIIAALKKIYKQVGFIKPVGQNHLVMPGGKKVDKDAVLFKEQFTLAETWEQLSPVVLPGGFTRDFLDGHISESPLLEAIKSNFDEIHKRYAYTVVEGTGHIGVGSIIGMNNAKIASLLGLDMILIATGGLGSTFDELALNIELCNCHGVNIRGIILNRVKEDKRDMILNYFPKALEKWSIPLVGCVPFNELLSLPTMRDFEILFETTLLSGIPNRYRHYRHHRLVASSLEAYLDVMSDNELVITPASREDIIEVIIDKHEERKSRFGHDMGCGIIMTSMHPPSEKLLQKIRSTDIPILYAPICSYDAMKMITSFTAKIRKEDSDKVEQAIKLVEQNLDINALLQPNSALYRR